MHHFNSTARQLRMKNQTTMVSAIAVMVFALFVSALLPTLLVRYVYAGQQLFEQPVVLQYLPVVAFLLGAGYFVYAVIINILREKRASYLEMMDDGCSCGHDHHAHHDMMNEVMAAAEAAAPKTTTRKKATAKTTRKSTKSSKK